VVKRVLSCGPKHDKEGEEISQTDAFLVQKQLPVSAANFRQRLIQVLKIWILLLSCPKMGAF